jgi:protein-disulfide isomerase
MIILGPGLRPISGSRSVSQIHRLEEKRVTVFAREHIRFRTTRRWLATALLATLVGVLLLAGLPGCSTPEPPPTNTPTVQAQTPTPTTQETPQATTEPLIPLDDDPVLGSPDAPVTMIEYSEYLCPYCRRFVLETMPLIEEEYIDTGKVKLVFRDFPVHGQPAVSIAMVAECAADQGKFWEMHVLLFERAEEWSESEDVLATFQGYAEELGMDQDEFLNCLELGTPFERIQEDYNLAIQDGVTGTPSFLINGVLVVGAQPFEEFQRIIEEELAKLGQ